MLTGSYARDASCLRWDGGIRVQSMADFFLIKDEDDELAVLPKKYLTEAEVLALHVKLVDRGSVA
ncbi:MAG TPA: hypothetical protein VLT62_20620 [Candidatus Methylomirabilis sp.]|nr:hypothetical protein [Candidatus Methylomirabilis sp.]